MMKCVFKNIPKVAWRSNCAHKGVKRDPTRTIHSEVAKTFNHVGIIVHAHSLHLQFDSEIVSVILSVTTRLCFPGS